MIGTQLGKNYHVIDKLDEGGMGVVYLVEHATLHKRFAAKVLAADLAANDEALRRFEVEAHAASKLEHENIVNVTDYGVAEDGRPYLVMELLRGKTLYERMADGPLSLEETIAVIIPVLRGLGAAHAEGFIHRDIKPENVFLTVRGVGRFGVKLLDFGITRLRAGNMRLTKMGQALGSPLYMAPESCKGEQIDARADIYSIGVLLYQLICGQLPFNDENILKVLHLQVMEPLRPPRSLVPELSVELDAVLCKALEKDPAQRYQTVEDLEDALLAALPPGADALLHSRRTPVSMQSVATPSAPLPVVTSSTTLSTRRSRLPLVVLALLIMAGAGAGAFVLLRKRGEAAEGPGAAASRAAVAAAPADAGAAARVAPEPPPAETFRIAVRTRPSGATVSLDGRSLGSTPLDVEAPVPATAGRLTIEAEGFESVERAVSGDKDIDIAVTLDPVAAGRSVARRPRPEPKRPTPPKPKPTTQPPDDKLEIRGAR